MVRALSSGLPLSLPERPLGFGGPVGKRGELLDHGRPVGKQHFLSMESDPLVAVIAKGPPSGCEIVPSAVVTGQASLHAPQGAGIRIGGPNDGKEMMGFGHRRKPPSGPLKQRRKRETDEQDGGKDGESDSTFSS